MPFCIIAAERESADLIKQDLIKTGLFPDWEFHICTSAQDLYGHSANRPDVVVVSRFLPGEEIRVLLQRLPLLFPASHIVLLVGNLDEKGRAFVRMAKQAGLNNIVTGKLPGDRPYNILAAVRYERQDDGLAALVGTGEEEAAAVDMVSGTGADLDAPEALAAPPLPCSTVSGTPVYHPPVHPVRQQVSGPVREGGGRRAGEGDYLDELLGRYGAYPVSAKVQPTLGAPEQPPARAVWGDDAHARGLRPGKRGVLVLTAANKGGSGKSTVAITLSVALARSGIPVVLWDLDFGGPDVAEFFDLLGKVRGIEALIPGSFRPEIVEGLLVKVEGEDNLWVLSGPMDHTIPCFEPGEVAAVARYLLSRYPLVIGDTAPEFWNRKPWLEELFPMADRVLAVTDQSRFSLQEEKRYAPLLLSMGVPPEKIDIVVTKYSPKLKKVREIEEVFCSGFKKGISPKVLPKVVAVIPHEWEEYVKKGYEGEVAGLDDAYSQWHSLAERIAQLAGYSYIRPVEEEKKRFFAFFSRKKSK